MTIIQNPRESLMDDADPRIPSSDCAISGFTFWWEDLPAQLFPDATDSL